MVEQVQISDHERIQVIESTDMDEIKTALIQILYVPNTQLKPYIIDEIMEYLTFTFSNHSDTIKVFIAYRGVEVCGYITVEIHPGYTSRNRKSATFGWLHANNFEICKLLIEACEKFAREHNMKLIRGNLNFPKAIGGMGIQEFGFDEQMLYGVPFNDPDSKITKYLEKLGYIRDGEYVCMEVTKNSWEMGKALDKSIKIRYLTAEELKNRREQILSMITNAFVGFLPDSSGDNKYDEVLDLFAQVPKSHYILPKDFDPSSFSEQPEFLEAWESCDLEKVNTFVHIAFDRKTDEAVGIIFCLPDKYELLQNKPVTRVNVDTVVVRKGYGGKGIFSTLNNIGQLTGNMNGVTYYEGTGIWMVNEDAVRAILPHGRINRRFFVWQKRLKKNKT